MFTFKTNELVTLVATALVWVAVWSFVDITMSSVNIKYRAMGYLFILAVALVVLCVCSKDADEQSRLF